MKIRVVLFELHQFDSLFRKCSLQIGNCRMGLGSSAATLEEDSDLVACDGYFRRVLHWFAIDILDRLPHCLQLLDLAGSDLKRFYL